MKLKVGDSIVYRAHGAGRIAAREQRVILGVKRETVVLDLADGLSVGLTVEQAHEQVRPAIDAAGLRRVQRTLRDDAEPGDDVWLKRMKATQAKVSGGDALEVAEVVRDGERRSQRLNAKGGRVMLSPSEKEICGKARRLLGGEIALSRGLDLVEADAWIERQLVAGKVSEARADL